MKKQLIIVSIIVLLVCVRLSGCEGYDPIAEKDRQKIVGTWVAVSGNMTLKTLTFSQSNPNKVIGEIKINKIYNLTWEISNHGIIHIEGWLSETNHMDFRYSYKFSNDYNTLMFAESYGGFDIHDKVTTTIVTVYIRI